MSNYSEAAERNKKPIYQVLKKYLAADTRLLEIGTGTAQHAIYMATKLQNVQWICSDRRIHLEDIEKSLKKHQIKNLHGPLNVEIGIDDFPKGSFDYVYTANTLHIMSWKENKAFFKLLGKRLREGALVFIYGPFNFEGEFSSPSNKQFDEMLRSRDPHSGIRNFEDILANMTKFGFKFLENHQMPANNNILVFERLPFSKDEK